MAYQAELLRLISKSRGNGVLALETIAERVGCHRDWSNGSNRDKQPEHGDNPGNLNNLIFW